jgi:signal transduction histidine kinase
MAAEPAEMSLDSPSPQEAPRVLAELSFSQRNVVDEPSRDGSDCGVELGAWLGPLPHASWRGQVPREGATSAWDQRRLQVWERLSGALPGVIYQWVGNAHSGQWRYTYFSPALTQLWEVSPQDAVQSWACLHGRIHPQDQVRFHTALRSAIIQGQGFQQEFRIYTASGQIKWIQALAQPLSPCRQDRTLCHFNSLLEDDPGDRPSQEAAPSRPQYKQQEIKFLDLEPSDSMQECESAPTPQNSPCPFRVFNGLLIDITERKQAEQNLHYAKCQLDAVTTAQVEAQTVALEEALKDLQNTQARLIHTEKMSSLGKLVAGVAHELNNPTNFIHGNLSYVSTYCEELIKLISLYQLYHQEPNPVIQERIDALDLDFVIIDLNKILSSMGEGSERIKNLVLSLRNFARLDESKFKRVDLHDGIDSTLELLQHQLAATSRRGAIVVHRRYGDLPSVQCFASDINQAFINILTNAIEALDRKVFAPPEVPQIWITTEFLGPDHVTICFRDNGPGVPLEIQTKLFDPFFTTKPVGQGTGMGLAVSYQILNENHQASFECYSQPNKGAEFRIALPIHPAFE